MVDFDALEAAGIANAHERAALIEYLDDLGFSADEMVEAERRGRLFGLAGDVLHSPDRPIFSLCTAAEALSVPVDDLSHAWAVLGLTVPGPDELALSQSDVDALAVWVTMKQVVGEEATLGFLRVLGAAMARLAEAGGTAIRLAQPDVVMSHSKDELTTARAYRAVAGLIPRVGQLMEAVWVHHMISVRTYFEGVIRDSSASVTCGVGFADLTGFTTLTQRLTPAELSSLLDAFNATVTEVVHRDGGRVVKFIGDEVMWVSSTAHLLAKVAVDLVEHPRAREAGLQVRAGLAFGSVLAIGGDYFGNPVNLAARLVGAAKPGQILAESSVCDLLADWPAVPQEPLSLKGFDSPVTVCDLHPGR